MANDLLRRSLNSLFLIVHLHLIFEAHLLLSVAILFGFRVSGTCTSSHLIGLGQSIRVVKTAFACRGGRRLL